MARRVGYIQDKIAPPRFLWFLAINAVGFMLLRSHMGWERALMSAFDIATVFFVLTLVQLLRTTEAEDMRQHALENDVNRIVILIITLIVGAAIFVSIASELNVAKPNGTLVVGTLAAAWIFSNVNFALHYSFLYWLKDGQGGFEFAHTDEPDYVDFVYLAFTVGMSFATSDVNLTARNVRMIVLLHALSSYAFNIGALAFSVNVLSAN